MAQKQGRGGASPASPTSAPALCAHLSRMHRSLQLVSGLGPLSQLHYETGLR